VSDAPTTSTHRRVLDLVSGPVRGARGRTLLANVVLYVLAILAALSLSALLILVATDASPWSVFEAMYEGSLKDGRGIGLSLDKATPILIVALGAILATRAGIINIGQEGQLIIGATFATAVALEMPGSGLPVIIATLVVAAAGGALWAGIAALLRFARSVDVVISTLLLNFIAFQVVSFAVNRTWLLRETALEGQLTVPQSDRLPADTHLPRMGSFPDFNVSSAIFIAIAAAVLVTVVLKRTRWGFRLRMLGLNPMAAASAGVSVAVFGSAALVLSGAFAGLAGGAMLTGTVFRLQPGFSNNVGFDGLLAALIARRNPVAAVPVAFFFGVLRAGGGFLAATGVPRFLVDIVQSLLVLAALFPPVFLGMRERRRQVARARAAARMSDGPVTKELEAA
jgi:general nucleoside transport system permease protein